MQRECFFSAILKIFFFSNKIAIVKVMVLILDGNSGHVVHALGKIALFGKKKILFETTLELIKRLEQIK